MSELRKLTDSIFCCKLEDPVPEFTGKFSCFILANRNDDYDYAKSLCKQFILTGCRYFHTYGRHSSTWDEAADWACIELGGLENEEIFTMTAEYMGDEGFDEFKEEIYHHYLDCDYLPEEGHKYLLLYDDEECAAVMIKYVSDIYTRDCKLREGITLIDQTFAENGALFEGAYFLDVERYDQAGHMLESMGPYAIKNLWSFNSLYLAADTILFPDNPCLTVLISTHPEGSYKDALDPINYMSEEMALKKKISLLMDSEKAVGAESPKKTILYGRTYVYPQKND